MTPDYSSEILIPKGTHLMKIKITKCSLSLYIFNQIDAVLSQGKWRFFEFLRCVCESTFHMSHDFLVVYTVQ